MRAHVTRWPTLTLLLLAAGCSTQRAYPPPGLPTSARLVEVGAEPAVRLVSAPGAAERPPRELLVLSGGGLNGAYTAGILKGWTASGRRPRFDVVTGVSTGALIAPFAFLGPSYDGVLEVGYTTIRAADLYRIRDPLVLPWSDALADAGPLRRRVEAEITDDVVRRVAAAHAEGRRLYVGTTNLDTKRLVVWDLGAVAAGGDPGKVELFRNVLLASCAVPGLLPPVPIDIEVDGRRRTELHVDGGVSASLFLPPPALGPGGGAAGARVSVIVAGKLRPESRPIEPRFLRVSGEALSAVLQSRLEGDLLRLYLLAGRGGADFRLAAVPEDMTIDSNWMALEGPALRRLFDAGYEFGRGGTGWRPTPPGLPPGDEAPPRAGVRFTVVE